MVEPVVLVLCMRALSMSFKISVSNIIFGLTVRSSFT